MATLTQPSSDDALTRDEARMVLPGLERVISELRKDRAFFDKAIVNEADRRRINAEHTDSLALAYSARAKLRRTAS